MEIHNLLFMFFLVLIFTGAAMTPIIEMQIMYPNSNATSVKLSNFTDSYGSVNSTLDDVNKKMTAGVDTANPLNFLGYMSGTFDATVKLVRLIPDVIGNFATGFGVANGLLPWWFGMAISGSLALLVIIGFLCYWTKVK